MVSCFLALAVSAYGLYYMADESREFIRWLHIGVGVIGSAGLPLYDRLGRRSRALGRA